MRIMIMGAFASLAVAASAAHADTRCYTAESVPDGMSYHVRNGITTPNHAIKFVSFTSLEGQPLEGIAKVTSRNVNGTSVKGVELSKIVVRHQSQSTPSSVVIRYADFGGGVNLRINGAAAVAASFAELHGRQIGGATINVQQAQPGSARVGVLRLTGELASFAVGGASLLVEQACGTF
jgi:hypothetical protein